MPARADTCGYHRAARTKISDGQAEIQNNLRDALVEIARLAARTEGCAGRMHASA